MDPRTGREPGESDCILGVGSRLDEEPGLDDQRACWKGDPLIRTVIAIIGTHSCVLGGLMLLVPRLMLGAFGFPQSTPVFFPSQSGIFLLILGICYLLALREPALVKIIVISKAFAVVFLAAHSVLLSAPPSIWAAGVGDGAMLCTMCLALRRHRRLEGPGALKAARAEELHFSRGDG